MLNSYLTLREIILNLSIKQDLTDKSFGHVCPQSVVMLRKSGINGICSYFLPYVGKSYENVLLDEFNSNRLQMTFWGFDGDHVSHNSEKRLFIIPQKYFFHQLERLPLVMVGEVGDRPRVYLFGVPPTATALLENLMLENYHVEERDRGRKLIGSIKINPKIAIAFMGALF